MKAYEDLMNGSKATLESDEPEPLWYLKALPYGAYRQTAHWRQRKQDFLASCGPEPACARCGLRWIDHVTVTRRWHVDALTGQPCSARKKHAELREQKTTQPRPARFEVHHLRYDHLGHEPDEDLELVCAPCHNLAHFPDSHAAQWWAEILESGAIVNGTFYG